MGALLISGEVATHDTFGPISAAAILIQLLPLALELVRGSKHRTCSVLHIPCGFFFVYRQVDPNSDLHSEECTKNAVDTLLMK